MIASYRRASPKISATAAIRYGGAMMAAAASVATSIRRLTVRR
jgi:hypothetical protein